MKTILLSLVLFVLTFCASAQNSTNQPARLKFKVAWFAGKMNSGTSGSDVCPSPESILPGARWSNNRTTPGREHDLNWMFIGRNRDKDVYRFTFTRMTKVGSSDRTTSSKEVQFAGKQIIVFEDALHCVVMESPSEKDLKSAQRH